MDIATNVRKAISLAFPDIPIYAETVRQGYTSPCFFVRTVTSNENKELGNRYRCMQSFEIQYRRDAEDADEWNAVGAKLSECLKRLDGIGVCGRKITYKVNDKVLYFTVYYSFCAFLAEEDAAKMGAISQVISLGGQV